MRPFTTPELTALLAADGITTAIGARLEFKSGTLFVWTGTTPLTVSGTGDSQLDGNTFSPVGSGLPLEFGDNAFSFNGSEAMEVTLAIGNDAPEALRNSVVFAEEYQARTAVFWRFLIKRAADPTAQPTWLTRRVRAGAMDRVDVTNDGTKHIFKLTVESHASLVSTATNASYLTQERFDPTDTSQRFAPAITNGGLEPGIQRQWLGFGIDINGNVYKPSQW